MSEGIVVAMLTIVGTILTAAATTILSRTRLSRLEAVSRVLKDLTDSDPAYGVLLEVREEDARELRRAQRSPWAAFFGFSFAAIVLGIAFTEYGEFVRTWSPIAYSSLVTVVIVSYLAVLGLYAALAYVFIRRVVDWLRPRVPKFFRWVSRADRRTSA